MSARGPPNLRRALQGLCSLFRTHTIFYNKYIRRNSINRPINLTNRPTSLFSNPTRFITRRIIIKMAIKFHKTGLRLDIQHFVRNERSGRICNMEQTLIGWIRQELYANNQTTHTSQMYEIISRQS